MEQTSEGLEDRVAKGELDLAVLTLPVRRVDLVQQKLWSEDFVLAVPRGHPLAEAKKPVALRDVLRLPMIVMPAVAGTRALETAAEAAGEPINVVLETDNPEAMRRMVERGLGIALLPSIMARERTGRGFEVVEVGQGGVRRQVALLHRGESYLNAAAQGPEDLPGGVAPELLRSDGEEGLLSSPSRWRSRPGSRRPRGQYEKSGAGMRSDTSTVPSFQRTRCSPSLAIST